MSSLKVQISELETFFSGGISALVSSSFHVSCFLHNACLLEKDGSCNVRCCVNYFSYVFYTMVDLRRGLSCTHGGMVMDDPRLYMLATIVMIRFLCNRMIPMSTIVSMHACQPKPNALSVNVKKKQKKTWSEPYATAHRDAPNHLPGGSLLLDSTGPNPQAQAFLHTPCSIIVVP